MRLRSKNEAGWEETSSHSRVEDSIPNLNLQAEGARALRVAFEQSTVRITVQVTVPGGTSTSGRILRAKNHAPSQARATCHPARATSLSSPAFQASLFSPLKKPWCRPLFFVLRTVLFALIVAGSVYLTCQLSLCVYKFPSSRPGSLFRSPAGRPGPLGPASRADGQRHAHTRCDHEELFF